MRDSHYIDPILSRRALGSLLHLIQYSFAICHTKRQLMNQEEVGRMPDLMPKPGRDRSLKWGPIITFRTYLGQGAEHGRWDYVGTANTTDTDLQSLNRMPGGRSAVAHSIAMINFWDAKTPLAVKGGGTICSRTYFLWPKDLPSLMKK